mgnify:CR=1 FL=1
MKLYISTGNSRMEKKWNGQEMEFSVFLERLSHTVRTSETMEQYRKLSKAKQDSIKDVGGFVLGKLKGGRRKKANVLFRSGLTLDMDYATEDIAEQIELFFDFRCLIYSTHKHTPEKPRLRLIIPLSRTVSPDEYAAVARKVAEDITPDYPNLKELIQNMFETMDHADGVGLAAPQIGLPIRVVVVDLDVLSEDYPEYKGFRKAYINAHILEVSGEEVSMEEGCLSLPGIHESVKRGNKIRVKYLDEDLVEHDEVVEGYLARVMQHEFDHLDGKMFIDHISPLRKQMIKGKLNAMLKGKARCSYKVKTIK